MLWRRHVQADDVFELLDELWVVRHFEGFDQIQLAPVGTPHLEHRGV